MLLLFDIGFLVVKNIKNHRFYPQNSQLQITIRKELDNLRSTNKLSKGLESILTNKLSKTNNLIIFQNELENKKLDYDFKPYIFAQINNYLDKSDYEQAYYTYLISTFNYENDNLNSNFRLQFMKFLNTKSLYTFTNTMKAIYAFGEAHLVVLAIDNIDERPGFYHKKLFVDGLLEFKGDREELKKELLYKFQGYSPATQESLLDYFRLAGEEVSDLCLEIVRNLKGNSQVRYSAMRYFFKFPSLASKNIFLDILKDEDSLWIELMLAIQGLSLYEEPRIKAIISKMVTSKNWYVRMNAIEYLHNMKISRDEIFDILFLRDKYANEGLLYQYKDDKEMSRYIINTIQMLNKEISESDEAINELA